MKHLFLSLCLSAIAAHAESPRDTIHFRSVLMIATPAGFADNIARIDPIEKSNVEGTWHAPRAGESVRYNDTLTGVWRSAVADSSGWYEQSELGHGYVYADITLDRDATFLLSAGGNSMVYVNGECRSGNPYREKDMYESWESRFDYSLLPVSLHAGRNEFLFACSRGRFKAQLLPAFSDMMLNVRDLTVPDLLAGESVDAVLGVVVMNIRKPLHAGSCTVEVTFPGGLKGKGDVPPLEGAMVSKIAVRLTGIAPSRTGPLSGLAILRSGSKILDSASIALQVVSRSDARRETFVSGIDGSVQYYAVLPPSADTKPAALILSLHGAGVEAIGQARSYAPKPWATLVAPTNRRPYGFNWEDWGRLDALEVLAIAKKRFEPDNSRIYLTGHSMGGHGTYHLGSLFPDQFAAIGPSAGWLSFWTYRVRETYPNPSPMRSMIMRATLPSATETFAVNYSRLGVYILHGSDDDNVLVEQSRRMNKRLTEFHRDFIYHEQPGVGHWWDLSDGPGADCVDWPPMMDFFARHARPEAWRVRRVEFSTPRPGISSDCDWLRIESQISPSTISSASLQFDPGVNRLSGSTRNIECLSLDLKALGNPDSVRFIVDSSAVRTLPTTGLHRVWYRKVDGRWMNSTMVDAGEKNPSRDGTFKDAFRNRFMFVYGTQGSQEETRQAFLKARFDAERFWYQGNGSVMIIRDSEFADGKYPDRNIVLYGNARTNLAWKSLLGSSPVYVTQDTVRIGSQTFVGNDLACLVIRPRPGSATASVGAVASTGLIGARLTDRMPYLLPGVAFPDYLVCRSSMLSKGEEGIEMAGFFGNDWTVENGEFVTKARK
jgi:predicted esterase